jgi:hypothetical protein
LFQIATNAEDEQRRIGFGSSSGGGGKGRSWDPDFRKESREENVKFETSAGRDGHIGRQTIEFVGYTGEEELPCDEQRSSGCGGSSGGLELVCRGRAPRGRLGFGNQRRDSDSKSRLQKRLASKW